MNIMNRFQRCQRETLWRIGMVWIVVMTTKIACGIDGVEIFSDDFNTYDTTIWQENDAFGYGHTWTYTAGSLTNISVTSEAEGLTLSGYSTTIDRARLVSTRDSFSLNDLGNDLGSMDFVVDLHSISATTGNNRQWGSGVVLLDATNPNSHSILFGFNHGYFTASSDVGMDQRIYPEDATSSGVLSQLPVDSSIVIRVHDDRSVEFFYDDVLQSTATLNEGTLESMRLGLYAGTRTSAEQNTTIFDRVSVLANPSDSAPGGADVMISGSSETNIERDVDPALYISNDRNAVVNVSDLLSELSDNGSRTVTAGIGASDNSGAGDVTVAEDVVLDIDGIIGETLTLRAAGGVSFLGTVLDSAPGDGDGLNLTVRADETGFGDNVVDGDGDVMFHQTIDLGSGTLAVTGSSFDSSSASLSAQSVDIAVENDSTLGTVEATTVTLASGGYTTLTGTIIADTVDYTSTATLDIAAGGFLSVPMFEQTGNAITLTGGTLEMTDIGTVNGTFTFTSGTLRFTDDLDLSSPGEGTEHFLGASPNVSAGQVLEVGGNLTLPETFDLGGGIIRADGRVFLDNLQTLSGHGTLAAEFQGLDGAKLIVDSGSMLTVGDADSFRGFETKGDIMVGEGGTLHLDARGYAALGKVTTLNDGLIEAPNGILLDAGQALTGNGTITGSFAAESGTTIVAENGALEIGDASAVDGFFSDGRLYTENNTVTLHDANQAVLGSLTVLGTGTTDGQLAAANGLLLEAGKDIIGRGTITVGDDIVNGLVGLGAITGDTAANPITIDGYVKGTGRFDNVLFNGTYSPGASPASVDVGTLSFADGSVLVMELGGTGQYQYDRLISDGSMYFDTAMLEVIAIDGFTAGTGDVFDLFDGSLIGTFSAISLPLLSEGLVWDLSGLYEDGIIQVGVIPEPRSLMLLVIGLVMALYWRHH